MPYAPIDVGFHQHPKYGMFTAAQMGLIACGITFCNMNLTDGVIPSWWPAQRFGPEGEKIARWLCGETLMDCLDRKRRLGESERVWARRKDGGFEIVGYLAHNASREQVLSKQRAAKDRVEAWRAKQKRGNAVTNGVRGGVPYASSTEPPPQPSPSPSPHTQTHTQPRVGSRKGASRSQANGATEQHEQLGPDVDTKARLAELTKGPVLPKTGGRSRAAS
jgi:hypothetical protein